MDIVLGVLTAPTAVRMVLIEGENADGVTVEEDTFELEVDEDSASSSAADQVIAAIVGTREGAAEGGYQLTSTGVTWTDPAEAGALRDALAGRGVGSAMLVSPLLAAAALAQTVGSAMGYAYTALLFIEQDSATLAVVDTADGAIVDLHRQLVHSADGVDELAAMVAGLDSLESRADGVFVVGCGVDIVPIKPALELATSLAVSAPEEPDMALARGAALASANAPLFTSSTAALGYAQDPGTGEVNPYAVAPTYIDVSANANLGDGALAYSEVSDEEDDQNRSRRRPFVLTGSSLAAMFIIGVVALVVSLAVDVRPTVGQRPNPGGNVVIPTKQVPAPAAAPAPAAPVPPPAAPPSPPSAAPAPLQQAPSPNPAPEAPVSQAPAQRAPTYVPPPAQPTRAPEQPPAGPPSTIYLQTPTTIYLTTPMRIYLHPPPPAPAPEPAPDPGP